MASQVKRVPPWPGGAQCRPKTRSIPGVRHRQDASHRAYVINFGGRAGKQAHGELGSGARHTALPAAPMTRSPLSTSVETSERLRSGDHTPQTSPSPTYPDRSSIALDGARIISAQIAQVQKDREACANALHSRLPASCPAFEAACEMAGRWCVGMLVELGGPWNILDNGREKFCAASRKHGASRGQRDRLWDAIPGERPHEQAVAAEMRYVKHFAGRIAADNQEEAMLEEAIAESLSGNADFTNLQTIPGIGPRTAAQLVVSVDISQFDSHDKLASYCGLAPPTQRSGTSVNNDKGHRDSNKPLKTILVLSCNPLVRPMSYYGEYSRRCLDRDMKRGCTLKATARKRMKVIYAVMRDGTPYSA